MNRWAQGIVGVGLFAVVGVATLYAASSLQGATTGQRAALALMELPDAAPGRNAFAALWLLPYDVPEGKLDAIVDEDRGRVASGATARGVAYVSVAAERYPPSPAQADEPPLCTHGTTGCLAEVRARTGAYQAWRERNTGLIERAGALSRYGHYRGGFEPSLAMPMPPVGRLIPTLLTDRALSFVEGRTDAALADLCGDVVTWRRLGPNSDSLVVSMLGVALAGDATVLFAEMLAELPVGQPLPPACAIAFAPPAVAELSLCEPLKGEFRFTRNALVRRDGNEGLADNPLFSRQMTDARNAAQMAQFCSRDADRALRQDRPLPAQRMGDRLQLDCVRNYAGCILSAVAAPAYRDYQVRAQDHGAKLRLAGTVAWLHGNRTDTRPLAAQLVSRPAALRSAAREIEIVDGGKALRVAMYGRHPAGHFQLPLAGYASGPASAD